MDDGDDANTELSRARARARLSRQELADAVNAYVWNTYRGVEKADATWIGHLEQGRNRWPRSRRREALRAVLGVQEDGELGLFCTPRGPLAKGERPEDRAAVRDRRRHRNDGSLMPVGWAGGDGSWQLRRRSLLWGISTVVAAAGLTAPEPGRRRRIGMPDVARLVALTSLYRSVDCEFGGGVLVGEVGRFAESASWLLDHEVSDAVLPPLLGAIANARDLAGWTAFDATRHGEAQRHFAAAERFAIGSGDRQLVAHIRYGQAKQMQHLRHNRDALDILRIAYHQLIDPTPGLTAILRGAEAASRAAMNDWDGACRALGESDDAFSNVDHAAEPEWLSFLDRGELLAQYGAGVPGSRSGRQSVRR